jgi:hypothetical protein
MTDSQIAFWLVTMGVIELIAVFIAVFVVFPSDNGMHIIQKVGFATMVFGLVVQLIRSVHYLHHGAYPIDKIFPMWITKDIGACVLIYYYSFIFPKKMNGHERTFN